MHLVDRHDIAVAKCAAQPPLADEQVGLHLVLAELLPQHLNGHDLAGLPMHGTIYAGERALSDQVKDPVIAEKEAAALAFDQAFDLVVGQIFAADQGLQEVVHRDVVAAQRTPHVLQLPFVEQSQVESALCYLFGRLVRHAFNLIGAWIGLQPP